MNQSYRVRRRGGPLTFSEEQDRAYVLLLDVQQSLFMYEQEKNILVYAFIPPPIIKGLHVQQLQRA